jgi:hypothetical protein
VLASTWNGSPEGAEDDPGNEIQEAFAFIAEQVRDWATEDGEPADRLKALRVTSGARRLSPSTS